MTDYKAWVDRAAAFVRAMSRLPGKLSLNVGIEAPISAHLAIDCCRQGKSEWLSSPECTLPREVRAFLWSASQRCYFNYSWTPPADTNEAETIRSLFPATESLRGGGDFCEAARFSNYDHREVLSNFEVEMPAELVKSLNEFLPDEAKMTAGKHVLDLTGGFQHERRDRELGYIALMTLENSDRICICTENSRQSGQVVYVRAANPSTAAIEWPGFDGFLADWETLCYIYPTITNLAPWIAPNSSHLDVDSPKTERLRSLFPFPIRE